MGPTGLASHREPGNALTRLGLGLGCTRPTEFKELRVVAQGNQICVAFGPIQVGPACFFCGLQHIERFAGLLEQSVGAGGIVENVGIARAECHGGLQLA